MAICQCCAEFHFEVAKFFIFFLTLFLTAMGASAVTYIAGATFSAYALASSFSVFIYTVMAVGLYAVFY